MPVALPGTLAPSHLTRQLSRADSLPVCREGHGLREGEELSSTTEFQPRLILALWTVPSCYLQLPDSGRSTYGHFPRVRDE